MDDFTALRRALPQILAYEPEEVTCGRSTSAVRRLVSRGMPTLFLKTAIGDDAAEIMAEHERLLWLAGRLSVPRIVGFTFDANRAALLTEELPGVNGKEVSATLWPQVTMQLAVELRRLHSLDPSECPFDRTLARVLPSARTRAMAGRVDETNFDTERLGHDAIELLESLYAERPGLEDVVVTHGDACLPNVIFDGGKLSGFVDCGRCGRADRYQDLALVARSIGSSFGRELAAAFFDAYGIDAVDKSKVSYYQLLDELF